MSVEKCIEEYKMLAERIFKPRKRRYLGGSHLWNFFGHSTFNAKHLEAAIKHILRTAEPPLNEDAMLLEREPECKM